MEEILKKIINEWNPIEIYPLLKDEYSDEIKKIKKFMESNPRLSYSELAIFLEKTFVDSFGENLYFSNEKRCNEISIKILDELSKWQSK